MTDYAELPISVAVGRYIMLCSALMEDAYTGLEANHLHTNATFPELNVDPPNFARARGNNPPISEGELLVTRLEAVGVHEADGMGAALKCLGLRTPADLELLDNWAVAKLDKEALGNRPVSG